MRRPKGKPDAPLCPTCGYPVPTGNGLTGLRLSRRMSLTDVQEKTGVARSHIWKLEAGTSDPTMGTAKKLADAYGVTLDELYQCMKEGA